MPVKSVEHLSPISRAFLWCAKLSVGAGAFIIVLAACTPMMFIIKDALHMNGSQAGLYRLAWGIVLLGLFILLVSQLHRCIYFGQNTFERFRDDVGNIAVFIGVLLIVTAVVILLDCSIWGNIEVTVLYGVIGRAFYYASAGLIALAVAIGFYVLHAVFKGNHRYDGYTVTSDKEWNDVC